MESTFVPVVAIVPFAEDGMVSAVAEGGGRVGDPQDADALVWTDPRDPEGLKDTLAASSARWIQLPFAGIESFVAAGVIDPGRTWTCAKGIYGHACAEHALALMLAASRQIHRHARATTWREPGFGSPERRLKGLTVLIVGAGGIGRELIRMLEPIEARAVAVNRSGNEVPGADATHKVGELQEVIGDADFVVVTAALTDETRGLIGRDVLGRMKSDAWIVNVARGGLIETDALVEALSESRIGGAALDVTDPEPLPDGHPLWGLDNALITPHVANTWDMALPELRALVRRNVGLFAGGEELEGLVDPARGY
jgi:phosphoglycerate dehydrogenase-like enzyme